MIMKFTYTITIEADVLYDETPTDITPTDIKVIEDELGIEILNSINGVISIGDCDILIESSEIEVKRNG